jgi:hypothetical protein
MSFAKWSKSRKTHTKPHPKKNKQTNQTKWSNQKLQKQHKSTAHDQHTIRKNISVLCSYCLLLFGLYVGVWVCLYTRSHIYIYIYMQCTLH